MKNEDMVKIIRDVAAKLEAPGGADKAADIVSPLRTFTMTGIGRDQGSQMDSGEEGFRLQLRWFGGELLDLIDNKHYYAVNSWLNCVDKFTTPAKGKS